MDLVPGSPGVIFRAGGERCATFWPLIYEFLGLQGAGWLTRLTKEVSPRVLGL